MRYYDTAAGFCSVPGKDSSVNNLFHMTSRLKGYLENREGKITGVASTEAVDRDGEVIRQAGWDLKNYLKNPVLMLMHNYQEFPVGRVTNIEVMNGQLTFEAVFSKTLEKATEAYNLVQEGILSAFSVGFIPRQYDPNDANIITEAELLEISLVPVPANPQAIVLAKSFTEKHADSEIASYIVKNFLVEPPQKKEEKTNTPPQETEGNSAIAPEVPSKDEVGKEGEKASEIDLKLVQATVGHLQILCRELKKKGGAK